MMKTFTAVAAIVLASAYASRADVVADWSYEANALPDNDGFYLHQAKPFANQTLGGGIYGSGTGNAPSTFWKRTDGAPWYDFGLEEGENRYQATFEYRVRVDECHLAPGGWSNGFTAWNYQDYGMHELFLTMIENGDLHVQLYGTGGAVVDVLFNWLDGQYHNYRITSDLVNQNKTALYIDGAKKGEFSTCNNASDTFWWGLSDNPQSNAFSLDYIRYVSDVVSSGAILPPPVPVPVPMTLSLLGVGALAALSGRRRRR